MDCVSCDVCVYHLWFVCVFPSWGISQRQSDWSLSCDHTDLIMRVNVRATSISSREKRCGVKGGVGPRVPPLKPTWY